MLDVFFTFWLVLIKYAEKSLALEPPHRYLCI